MTEQEKVRTNYYSYHHSSIRTTIGFEIYLYLLSIALCLLQLLIFFGFSSTRRRTTKSKVRTKQTPHTLQINQQKVTTKNVVALQILVHRAPDTCKGGIPVPIFSPICFIRVLDWYPTPSLPSPVFVARGERQTHKICSGSARWKGTHRLTEPVVVLSDLPSIFRKILENCIA